MNLIKEARFLRDNTKNQHLAESRSFYCALFFAGLVILFLRSTYTFSSEVLYTEDGSWLGQIYQNGFWHMLFHAKGSYLVFANIIMLKIADTLNLLMYGDNVKYLPLFVALVQYLFYAACAVMPVSVFRKHLLLPARLFIWLLILLLPIGDMAFEIFGKISNVGYMFYFVAFCLLFYRAENKSKISLMKLIIVDLGIFISCATNPTCYVLVVAFFAFDIIGLWRNKTLKTAYKLRYVRCWFVLGVLLTAAFVYILTLSGEMTLKGSGAAKTLHNTISFIARNVLYPFTFAFYGKLSIDYAVILLLLVGAALVIAGIFSNKSERLFPIAVLSTHIFYTISKRAKIKKIYKITKRSSQKFHLQGYPVVHIDKYDVCS
ncbi:MAG: hypothetical protein LBL96_03575, partial [Clostridiales bacterium]|nr:hypothetical protein [Clostridiales bacterium]